MKSALLEEFSTKVEHLKGLPPSPQMQVELAIIAEPYLVKLLELGDDRTEALKAMRRSFFGRFPPLAKLSFKHLEKMTA